MKSCIVKILFALLIFNCGVLLAFPQASAPPVQSAEVMDENERLPFMQHEKSADTADSSSGSLLLRTLGAMLLIVGIIFFGAWGLKKFGFGNQKSNAVENAPELVILSTVTPMSGSTLSVVRFGEKTLLVGSTAQSFTLLAELNEEANEQAKDAAQTVLPKGRSVADLLAEEQSVFDKELARASAQYDLKRDSGGLIS